MIKRIALVTFLGMCLLFNSSAYAHSGNRDGQHSGPGKILKKTNFLLEHQADLGLTADQVKTVEGIKAQAEGGAKESADAYAQFKSTLTPEQLAKIKELFKNKKEQWKNKS